MVFTQSHDFVVGALFGLPCSFAPFSRLGWQRRGHCLFGKVDSFW